MTRPNGKSQADSVHIINSSVFVVASPRMPSAVRSTGEGKKDGARIEEIGTLVLTDELLRPLSAVKTRLRRTLMKYAAPINAVAAWLVPAKRCEELQKEIETLRVEWKTCVDIAVAELPAATEKLCQQYPAQEETIREHALTEEKFRTGCQFVYSVFRIDPEMIIEGGGVQVEMQAMERTVVEEIGKMVRDSKRDKSVRVDAGSVDFLRTIQAKAEGFAFVGQHVARLALQLKQALQLVASVPALMDEHKELITAAICNVADTDTTLSSGLKLEHHIKKVMDLNKPKAAPAPSAKAAPAPAAPKHVAPKHAPAVPVAAPVVTPTTTREPARSREAELVCV